MSNGITHSTAVCILKGAFHDKIDDFCVIKLCFRFAHLGLSFQGGAETNANSTRLV